MESLNTHDLIEIVTMLLGFIVTIVTVKVDMKWIKQWLREHKESDSQQFTEIRHDLRDLRKEVRAR